MRGRAARGDRAAQLFARGHGDGEGQVLAPFHELEEIGQRVEASIDARGGVLRQLEVREQPRRDRRVARGDRRDERVRREPRPLGDRAPHAQRAGVVEHVPSPSSGADEEKGDDDYCESGSEDVRAVDVDSE